MQLNYELITDIDMLTNELEWAMDALAAIHTTMEEDGGANWQRRCNAVFFVYLTVCSIRDRLDSRINQAMEELRSQRRNAQGANLTEK